MCLSGHFGFSTGAKHFHKQDVEKCNYTQRKVFVMMRGTVPAGTPACQHEAHISRWKYPWAAGHRLNSCHHSGRGSDHQEPTNKPVLWEDWWPLYWKHDARFAAQTHRTPGAKARHGAQSGWQYLTRRGEKNHFSHAKRVKDASGNVDALWCKLKKDIWKMKSLLTGWEIKMSQIKCN